MGRNISTSKKILINEFAVNVVSEFKASSGNSWTAENPLRFCSSYHTRMLSCVAAYLKAFIQTQQRLYNSLMHLKRDHQEDASTF